MIQSNEVLLFWFRNLIVKLFVQILQQKCKANALD